MMENAEIVIRVLAEEVQRLTWRAEYAEKKAEKAENELAVAQKKIDDLSF